MTDSTLAAALLDRVASLESKLELHMARKEIDAVEARQTFARLNQIAERLERNYPLLLNADALERAEAEAERLDGVGASQLAGAKVMRS